MKKLKGTIVDASPVDQYVKYDGTMSVKATLVVEYDDPTCEEKDERYRQKVFQVTGDLTRWVTEIGIPVEVDYKERRYDYQRRGIKWFGLDCFAMNIQAR